MNQVSGGVGCSQSAPLGSLNPTALGGSVVLIGNSAVARWPMEQLGDRWQFINRGIGGETVGQVAQRFDTDTDALNLSADVIVLCAGLNDLLAADFLDPASRRAVIHKTGAGATTQRRRRPRRQPATPPDAAFSQTKTSILAC